MADNNDIKERRSKVRMNVTYGAAAFIFLGGGAIITYAIFKGDTPLAKDTFNVVLPIGTAIVTYWFAGRSAEKAAETDEPGNQDGGNPSDDQGGNQ